VIFARTLGETLHDVLEKDARVVLIGEDILDPYGGAFKVTRGLSTAFPDRVRTTPVSEAAIVGVAAGLALAGYRPIVEIMFGDFLALCYDQVVNHIAKYEAMYAGGASCPVIIRTPSGGGRGYGPTHSQSLEKHFVGIPHLRVVAASLHHDPNSVFSDFLVRNEPVLYVEHKLLYPMRFVGASNGDSAGLVRSEHCSPSFLPTVSLRHAARESCAATVLAYGYQAELALRVIDRLARDEEIFAELLVPAQIAPIDWSPIEESARVTGSLLTIEEGTSGWSWGAGVAAEVGKRLFSDLRRGISVLASASDVLPASAEREAEVLVGERQIEAAIREAAA
jgi:pyruvate/2-oxoglutarate/acetoin dehydrogenase E1 component